MKKLTLLVIIILSAQLSFSKKVKFAVDMSNEVLNVTGIHISSDFQLIIGDSADWCSDCTPLVQEGTSNIYSIVVDIPAFRKYEYKFLNGDQFYDAEFVPVESRVGYNFNDNRWIYVDSLADDTTFIGAMVYSGNAPAGMNLIRYFVDMSNVTVSSSGVHVAGDYQAWDPSKTIMYHFDDALAGVFELIDYVVPGTYQYKFFNGNSSGDAETVPGSCAVSSNRVVNVSSDIVLDEVCFSSCLNCSSTGIAEHSKKETLNIFPNPTADVATFRFTVGGNREIFITDISGQIIRNYQVLGSSDIQFEKGKMSPGIYFVNVKESNNIVSVSKLIIQ